MEVFILQNLASLQTEKGQEAKAAPYYEQILALHREMRNRAGEANLLFIQGWWYYRQSNYEKAVECFEQELLIELELKNRAGEGRARNGIGQSSMSLNRPEKARDQFEQTLTIAREIKNRASEAVELNNLGWAYAGLLQYEKAIEYYEQSLTIRREVKNRAGEALTLVNLGVAYDALSRLEKALEVYEQALKISREIKDRVRETRTLRQIGVLYHLYDNYERAIDYYQQALVVAREIKNRPEEATSLQLIGQAYIAWKKLAEAIEYGQQALTLNRELKIRLSQGYALDTLGRAYLFRGDYDQAIKYLEEGYAIALETKNRRQEAGALNNLGQIWNAKKQYAKAISFYAQSLNLAREINYRRVESFVLDGLMQSWKEQNQPAIASFFGKQAINLIQDMRTSIQQVGSEAQQTLLKFREETYRNLADLLIAQGRLPEAEQVIRMLKEEEYFEYIRRDNKNSPASEKATLTPEEAALEKRYREIADKLTELGTERSALLEKQSRTPEEEQRLTKLEADLTIAGQMFQKFLDGLANELGKNAEASNRVFQLRESQGMMEALRDLGKGTVALYTLVGDDQYRVILTTADVQKGFAYPIKAADLNRKILAFRDVLQNPKLDPLPLAQELYKILIAPLAKDLKAAKAETLMWSLDSVLRYVPMAALHDGDKYLVERWRNVVFTPASQTRLKDDVSRNWKALGLGVTRSFGATIPALPGVAEETRGIIKAEGATSGVLPGTIKLDEQFTQEAMLTGLRARPPVVHVASHFQFKPGNETDSALLLGDGQFLSLAQIKSLPNVFSGVELLTLSACNTATGGSGATGKEVEGFGVLAQRQGAKAVVASLWPVADRSTKNLMQEFYKLREAKASTTKAEAMRQAQIKLLRGELLVTGETLAAREIIHERDKTTNQPLFKVDAKAPYAHPYYWAPFILIGNWK
jgi:CHAT domain-containing protein/uncharacterized protein HemY